MSSSSPVATTAVPSPGSQLISERETELLRRLAKSQADREIQQRQSQHTSRQVHFLAQSNDFRNYQLFKNQTQNFKACYWLALISIVILLYFDMMTFFVQAPKSIYDTSDHTSKTYNTYTGQYQQAEAISNARKEYEYVMENNNNNNNRRNNNREPRLLPQIIGALVRSTTNVYVNTFLSLFCVLFLLPWSIIAVWSPCDEDPKEHSAYSALTIHWRALLLMHAFGILMGLKVNFEPFLSVLEDSNTIRSKPFEERTALGFGFVLQMILGLSLPAIVAYFMFYRRFAKFWKGKDLLRWNPIFVYAPWLGLSVVFSWWFSSSLIQAYKTSQPPSIDALIAFLFRDVPPLLREAFLPSVPMKPNQMNAARAVIVEMSTKIYLMLLPYCAFLILVCSIPSKVYTYFSLLKRFGIAFAVSFILRFLDYGDREQWTAMCVLALLWGGNEMFDAGFGED